MQKITVTMTKKHLTVEDAEELIIELKTAVRQIRRGQSLTRIDREYVIKACKDIGMKQNMPGRVWTRLCLGVLDGHVKDLDLTCKWCGQLGPKHKKHTCYGCTFPKFTQCYFAIDQLRSSGTKLLEVDMPYAGAAIRQGFQAILKSIEE